jgi:hypothetical protein
VGNVTVFQDNMEALLASKDNNNLYADAKIIVGDTTFHVHK